MRFGSILPRLEWARSYRRTDLPHDVFAGIVLTAILVPAGMAYAEAAGLPPIVGLYASIVPLLVYAVLGPSRILVLGPDSSLLPIIAAAIVPLAAGDDARATGLSALLAVIVGGLVIAAGLARLGFLTALLSAPVRHGYLNGIALIVVVSQLPRLFGFTTTGDSVVDRTRSFVAGLAAGETNTVALAIGVTCLVVILGLRQWRPGIPGILVAVVGSTIVSAVFDLSARAGIAVVGPLPVGLPPLTIPPLAGGDILALVPAALGIALVSATDTSVLSRTFSLRRHEEVDQDRELLALGGANLATGLLSGMPVSSSASRTPVAEAAGARSQLTSVVGALAIAVMLVADPGLLEDLPTATLAAVVITAGLSLVEIGAIARLWRLGSSEFWLALASFLGVAFVGVIEGVFFAVALSLLAFIRRAWWPHDAVMGRADGVKGYHDLTYYPEARQVPGLVLYRFDAPLFFANADVFRDRIRERIASAEQPVRWVVVAAEPITDVDTTAAAMLDALEAELAAAGITFAFAELKDPVRASLRRYGALERIPDERIFPTVGTAVSGYLKATGQSWTDWEEDARPGHPPSGA
jgi:high affinity sulfate transporter 1